MSRQGVRVFFPPWNQMCRVLIACIVLQGACGRSDDVSTHQKKASAGAKQTPKTPSAETETEDPYAQDFPQLARVTGIQLVIRAEPKPDALTLGWLREKSEVRLGLERVRSPGCKSGWAPIAPKGWLCVGEGIEWVDQGANVSHSRLSPAAVQSLLPYRYYFVREALVPDYKRLPSIKEHEAMRLFVERFRVLRKENPAKAKALLEGKLAGEPVIFPFVDRMIEYGFFVAGVDVQVQGGELRFVRSARGTYVDEQSLIPRTGSSFHGVELGRDHFLPVAWAVRATVAMKKKLRKDGTLDFARDPEAQVIERYNRVPWLGREYYGTRWVHQLDAEHYLHPWFLAVAEKMPAPKGIGKTDSWIHIDLSEQTLVLYEGHEPRFATLVSSGLQAHPTPVGEFFVRAKLRSATMSDIGEDVPKDDRYRIEDVPWTMYFRGSLAMHGAFWHDRFGLRRSHGCVNLSPYDAHRIFDVVQPRLPRGWHGISARETGERSSRVIVTD